MKHFVCDYKRTAQLNIPEAVVVANEGDDKTFCVIAKPSFSRANCCPICNQEVQQRGYKIRKIRDCIESPDGVKHINLQYYQRQFSCKNQNCRHSFSEDVSFFEKTYGATNRLKQYIYERVIPQFQFSIMAKEVGVSYDTIGAWFRSVRVGGLKEDCLGKNPKCVAISQISIAGVTYAAVANVDDNALIAFWPCDEESTWIGEQTSKGVAASFMRDNAVECIQNAECIFIDPHSDFYNQALALKDPEAKIYFNPYVLRDTMCADFSNMAKKNLSAHQAKRFIQLVNYGIPWNQGDCNFINRVLNAHSDLRPAYEAYETLKSCGYGKVKKEQLAQLIDYMKDNGIVPNINGDNTIDIYVGAAQDDFPKLYTYNLCLKDILRYINKLIEKAKGIKANSIVEYVVDCVYFANPRMYEEEHWGYSRYVSVSPFDNYPEKDGYSYYYIGRGLQDIIINLVYKNDLSDGSSSEGEWLAGRRPYEGPVLYWNDKG